MFSVVLDESDSFSVDISGVMLASSGSSVILGEDSVVAERGAMANMKSGRKSSTLETSRSIANGSNGLPGRVSAAESSKKVIFELARRMSGILGAGEGHLEDAQPPPKLMREIAITRFWASAVLVENCYYSANQSQS
jgi:hypothetical protein